LAIVEKPETTDTIEQKKIDLYWMQKALRQAHDAAIKGEVPVGAVLISQGELLAEAANQTISNSDPTAHAEILVIRRGAAILQNYRLPGTTLYVTLEPGIMCVGAMIHDLICRLVYGTPDPKTGAVSSRYSIGTDGKLNHSISVTGSVLAEPCGEVLKHFFRKKRSKNTSRVK
jgi:tRNA(adenine34) deaminase